MDRLGVVMLTCLVRNCNENLDKLAKQCEQLESW